MIQIYLVLTTKYCICTYHSR